MKNSERGGLRITTLLLSPLFLLALGLPLGTLQAAAQAPQTHTAFTIATSPTTTGRVIVLSAHVTDSSGAVLHEQGSLATVSFETHAGSLGSAILDENGDAKLSVTSLPVEADHAPLAVHAVFHPVASTDGTLKPAGSTSGETLVQADVTGVPDFTITATPASLTTTQGQFATTLLTITPLFGFSEQVTLSCAGLPAQVTCNFSPVIASTANGPFTSTLEVQTQTAAGALTLPEIRSGRGAHVAFAWALPGLLALAGFATRRRLRTFKGWREVSRSSVVLLLFAAGLALAGCSARYGYNHHSPAVATGTPLGTFTLSIDAAGNDGSAVTTHTIPLTLQVQ